MAIRKELEGGGYEVIEAASGVEALEMAQGGGPQLVLLDMNMPEMDGIAVYEKLLQTTGRNDIPAIFLSSADCLAERRADIDRVGAGSLAKGSPAGELLKMVQGRL